MTRHILRLFTLFIALLPVSRAQEWIKLEAANNLLGNASELPWVAGGENSRQISFQWQDETDNGPIFRIETLPPRSLKYWAVRVETPLKQSLKKGDILYLRFKVRCLSTNDETGRGTVRATLNYLAPPFTQEISEPFSMGSEWHVYATRTRVSRNYASRELLLNFRVGYAPQVVELKDLELFRFDSSFDEKRLPVTPPPTYKGREKDASWRQEAEIRIDKYRKQELHVTVLDAQGHALPAVPVSVEQLRHAYSFGTAVMLGAVLNSTPSGDQAMYRAVLRGAFNSCGPESDLKWHNWLREREDSLKALAWLKEQGLPIRGHCLLWPSWFKVPAEIRKLQDKPDELRQKIMDHVKDELTATAPYISEWDVVNEPLLNRDILEIFGGNLFMKEVFSEARKWAPSSHLFLNEAVTLSDNRLMAEFRKIVSELISLQTPFDGLGIQCHYSGWTLTPPDEIISTLDSLKEFGKAIKVTEFDIDSLDESLQADYLRDFYTAVFSHPATSGIQMWGFWEPRHWKSNAALWGEEWNVKPQGKAYLDLVYGRWWTREKGKTNENGEYSVRVFKGTQQVFIQTPDGLVTKTVEVGDEPMTLSVTQPGSAQ